MILPSKDHLRQSVASLKLKQINNGKIVDWREKYFKIAPVVTGSRF